MLWTGSEIRMLREHYLSSPTVVLAQALGRTTGAIHMQATACGLSTPRPRWMTRSADVYAQKFGVTRRAVRMVSLDVLDRCASDCARRLLLGVSEQSDEPVSRVAEKVRRVA